VPLAPQVEEVIARFPGTIRRGHALATRAGREERLSTGVPELDNALDGGLPRGQLSELVGKGSTGITSLAHRLSAGVTSETIAAWVDVSDTFDPTSATRAGTDLRRLLWIRPPDLLTALTATELLLNLGGFPLVLLDAAGLDRVARRADERRARGARMTDAPHTWARLARAAARSRSALVVLQRQVRNNKIHWDAGPWAAVRIEVVPDRVVWDRAPGAPSLLDGVVLHAAITRNRGAAANRLKIRLAPPPSLRPPSAG
jgi:RecA/RadA recombinase